MSRITGALVGLAVAVFAVVVVPAVVGQQEHRQMTAAEAGCRAALSRTTDALVDAEARAALAGARLQALAEQRNRYRDALMAITAADEDDLETAIEAAKKILEDDDAG